MPLKFYLHPLRFAGVICQIWANIYILRCQAFAWQRTIVGLLHCKLNFAFSAIWKVTSSKFTAKLLLSSHSETISNSLLWSLIIKYFWWRCFAPLACCARGQLPPSVMPQELGQTEVTSTSEVATKPADSLLFRVAVYHCGVKVCLRPLPLWEI